MVTSNVFVFPTTVKLPFDRAVARTELLMLAVPVTVNVVPEILQFVPDVPVCPPEEIVNVCDITVKEKIQMIRENKERIIITNNL